MGSVLGNRAYVDMWKSDYKEKRLMPFVFSWKNIIFYTNLDMVWGSGVIKQRKPGLCHT